MFEIPDFQKDADFPEDVIREYEGTVEPFLIDFWRTYGLGTAYEGYLRVIDPKEYVDVLGTELTGTGDRRSIPVLTTAMSDVIALEPGHGLVIIRFRDELSSGLFGSFESFIDMLDIDGADYFEIDDKAFRRGPYADAVARDGVPPYGKSFTFVPLPSMGGRGTVETMKVEDTLTAIRVMLEMQGPVKR
jgi:hypothetical protein